MTAAEAIAGFAHELSFAAIPDDVVERIQLHLLDVIGCALAADHARAGVQAQTWVLANEHGLGPSELWGGGQAASTAGAALANGMLAHALDFDDTHPVAMMHASAVIGPAAVAVAQARGSTGCELIEALVAGVEAAIRIGLVSPGAFHERGLHPTSTCGVFGATVAVTKLLGLDVAQTVAALGIAGSTSSGLFEFLADGSATKPFHAGWAAHAAVVAAGLAELGATGPATVLEGRFGLFRALLGEGADDEISAQVADLGERWETLALAIKPYPACHLTHAAMDAIGQLRAGGLRAEDVASMHVLVPAAAVGIVLEPAERKRRPTTPYEAKFSLPFCAARMLIDGRVGPDSFSGPSLQEPLGREMMTRITYEVAEPDGRGPFFTILNVEQGDGTVLTVDVPHPSGTPEAPLTATAVRAKFDGLARPRLGDTTDEAANAILSLVHADAVGRLWVAEAVGEVTPS